MAKPSLLRLLIFIDTLAVVPSLVLLIPAGMFFDGGYTTRAYVAFYTVLALPLSVITGLALAIRLRRHGRDGKATVAAAVPLFVLLVALVILGTI